MKDRHYLIVYDIRNEKRLHKVAKILEQYAVRVQKSVFEGTMSEKTKKKLKSKIEQLINFEEDYVIFFSICEPDWQKREKFGVHKYKDEDIETSDYYIF